jgi:hypothetical protein
MKVHQALLLEGVRLKGMLPLGHHDKGKAVKLQIHRSPHGMPGLELIENHLHSRHIGCPDWLQRIPSNSTRSQAIHPHLLEGDRLQGMPPQGHVSRPDGPDWLQGIPSRNSTRSQTVHPHWHLLEGDRPGPQGMLRQGYHKRGKAVELQIMIINRNLHGTPGLELIEIRLHSLGRHVGRPDWLQNRHPKERSRHLVVIIRMLKRYHRILL